MKLLIYDDTMKRILFLMFLSQYCTALLRIEHNDLPTVLVASWHLNHPEHVTPSHDIQAPMLLREMTKY